MKTAFDWVLDITEEVSQKMRDVSRFSKDCSDRVAIDGYLEALGDVVCILYGYLDEIKEFKEDE